MIYYEYEFNGKMVIEINEAENRTTSFLINKCCKYIKDLTHYCFNFIRNYNSNAMVIATDTET